MSEAVKHTPGPWVAVEGTEDDAHRWGVYVDGPRRWHVATIENGAPGDRLSTEGANARLIASAPKLAEFKTYVHARLDAAGVSADPDGPHKAEGCRVGGRLDELVGERDRLRAEVESLRAGVGVAYACLSAPDPTAAERDRLQAEVAKLRDACDTAAQALEGFDVGFARRARAELLAALATGAT